MKIMIFDIFVDLDLGVKFIILKSNIYTNFLYNIHQFLI